MLATIHQTVPMLVLADFASMEPASTDVPLMRQILSQSRQLLAMMHAMTPPTVPMQEPADSVSMELVNTDVLLLKIKAILIASPTQPTSELMLETISQTVSTMSTANFA